MKVEFKEKSCLHNVRVDSIKQGQFFVYDGTDLILKVSSEPIDEIGTCWDFTEDCLTFFANPNTEVQLIDPEDIQLTVSLIK